MRTPMRFLPALFLLTAALPAVAQEIEVEVDDAAAEAFRKLIQQHRAWPGVTVKSQLQISLEQEGAAAEGREVQAEFTHTKGGNGTIRIGGFTIHINDGAFAATHESNSEEYFLWPQAEYIHAEIAYTCFGRFERIPFPHLAIFWGSKDKMPNVYMELYADTPELVPAALKDRVLDSTTVRTIVMKGPDSSMDINIDPQSGRIHSIRHEITSGYLVAPGAKRINEYEFEYEIFAEPIAAEKLAFDPGERRRVDVFNSLVKVEEPPALADATDQWQAPAKVSLVGQQAPAFVLQTPEGELVDLEKLRGQVVVIDFWAVWCPPCVKALPELHKVAEWAKKENLPVRVYAVNTFENGNTLEEKIRTVTQFWTDAGHTLPVLMDAKNETAEAYNVRGIPATFVIGPDGVIVAEHSGFSPGYADSLKEEITEALKM